MNVAVENKKEPGAKGAAGGADPVVSQMSEVKFQETLSRYRLQGILAISFVCVLLLVLFWLIIGEEPLDDAESFSLIFSVTLFFIQTVFLLNMFYYYYIEAKLKIKLKQNKTFSGFAALKIIAYKLNMLLPVITHFADYATDIALLIEFYYVFEQEQQTGESEYTAENYLLVLNGDVDEIVIDYGAFFIVSLSILLIYKIVSSLIILHVTKSVSNAILQFFDVYIYKVIKISVQANLKKMSEAQIFVRLLETLFELSL